MRFSAVSGTKSLFTNFTAVNLGIPKNQEIPFYTENLPDSFGYTANPEGPTYQDTGLGAILPTVGNPDWASCSEPAGWTRHGPASASA